MSAPPSIPNLFSLRGARGGGGFRQRRGGGGGVAQSAAGHDATVQGTDTDAAVSRSSAVGLGYLDDPFAQYFVQNAVGPSSRRLPIINRGWRFFFLFFFFFLSLSYLSFPSIPITSYS